MVSDSEVDTYSMAELRALYERLARLATEPELQPEVLAYWQEKLRVLPQDDDGEELLVTSDEIATALLAWLEELLKDCLGDSLTGDADGGSEEASSEGDEEQSQVSRPVAFGFGTADFGTGGLA